MAETNETLKDLNCKRGQVKSKVTRFRSFIDTFNKNSQLGELKLRYKNFQDCLSNFDEIQCQIELLGENPEDQAFEREEFENNFYQLSSRAEEILSCTSNTITTHSEITNSHSQSSATSVKLPAINLPKFNGNYEDWIPFSELFTSLIHDNTNLSDVEKFHYLQLSLLDKVKPILSSLEASSANYATAWELLKDRYENKRIIVNKHIASLVNIEPIQKENASQLRHFLDTVNKHTRCLTGLGLPVDQWDAILTYILTKKLDTFTLRHWENKNMTKELPTMESFITFLNERCQILETLEDSKPEIRKTSTSLQTKFISKPPHKGWSAHKEHPPSFSSNVATKTHTCYLCNNSDHSLYRCPRMLSKSGEERLKTVLNLKLCSNCLNPGHSNAQCFSGKCRICSKKHNTLLHINKPPVTHQELATVQPDKQNTNTSGASVEPTVALPSQTSSKSQVILPTAIVYVKDRYGTQQPCRALLDSGSQTNFMTNRMVQFLKLKTSSSTLNIRGINQTPSRTMGSVKCDIQSRCTKFKCELEFHVVPNITQDMPNIAFETTGWEIPSWVELADPGYGNKGKIDMLIGNEIFFQLLCVGQFQPTQGAPVFQKTLLGWVAGGQVATQREDQNQLCLHISAEQLEAQIQQFWDIEEVDGAKHLSSDEQLCEEHYLATTQRKASGRYVVSLPLKENVNNLGESFSQAAARLESTERKLKRSPALKSSYSSFMKEYIDLNHMEPVSEEITNKKTYYLPHLPVIREASSTTKLRVVFDASAKTSSGISLNDAMRVGPTIQPDLFSTMCNFRTHTYAMSADITKMYRQIQLNETQRDLQRILWRFDPGDKIQIYRLNTVTYGTATAPFLAVRTLQKLAEDEQHNFPRASRILKEDFYVDDMMTGTRDLGEAISLQKEIISLLNSGGFELRKWSANHPDLLASIPAENREQKSDCISENDQSVKILGMLWNANKDCFHFLVKNCFAQYVTKRAILSDIAGLFDPLGLVGPVVLTAKIILQRLWTLKLGWDESLPQDVHASWQRFREDLHKIDTIRVPRQVAPNNANNNVSLHGFCDSSNSAYGACLYVRQENNDGVHVTLLCSKSRVAPLKEQTIPRLELCGALLLSRLLRKIRSIKLNISSINLWCDSTIVLAWIKAEPKTWKTFVSNRVQEINKLTTDCSWRHVSSKENPADLISRGLMPAQIVDSDLWWYGPAWLKQSTDTWPIQEESTDDIPERRKQAPLQTTSTLIAQKDTETEAILNSKHYSNLLKLQRTTAYCLRFIHNCQNPLKKSSGALSAQELNNALNYLIKQDQNTYLSNEIKNIEGNIKTKSNLSSLQPFVDDKGLLRVGGRLKNAVVSIDQKHPIILPTKSHLTDLIIRHEHARSLHAGPQLLLATVRQRFWPIGGRNATRKIVRQCVNCFKIDPRNNQPSMGDIPSNRLQPSRPFLRSGVDYFGPVYIKSTSARNARLNKCYVALFVCFTTKAIHLELVNGLTTDAFLAAFKRFIARRGICQDMYSDNGKNFVGAYREIQELQKLLQSQEHQNTIKDATSAQNVNWHFIPPRSPHFGGLWEAGVKSVKHHLKRVVKNAHLTYEKMYTVLTMVEACLNSRPLTSLPNHPSDPTPLTPGHFLIGDALTALPEPDVTHVQLNRLNQWQRTQQILQHFWRRWSVEYLSLLQQRHKWAFGDNNLRPGQIVLVKDDNLPPLKWLTAVIEDTHPGTDRRCRVATIRTTSGTYKRAANRLCPLPIE